MEFLSQTKNTVAYTNMLPNLLYLKTQCLHLKTQIGKWPWMMNIML